MQTRELARMLWEIAANPDRYRVAALSDYPQRTINAAADLALWRALVNTWPHGWLPNDLHQYIRRKEDEPAASLLVDCVAADYATYASETVHPRLWQQLEDLGGKVWWDRDQPLVGQWETRHGISRTDALATVVRLLTYLMRLIKLPLILPIPGAARSAEPAQTAVDPKVLSRVRGLLAKAESTQFPEEAEALSAKAQELMNRHAVDRAILDAQTHIPQTATSRRLWLENPYLSAKSQLVAVIADANRCRAVYYERIGFIALVGDDLDLEITELLSTSLLVQATRAMLAEGTQTSRTGQSRTRSYRQAFLVSYAVRIGERLHAANELPPDNRALPVLADRKTQVDTMFDEMFGADMVTKSVSVTNEAGWGAGRAAADRATLTLDRKRVSPG